MPDTLPTGAHAGAGAGPNLPPARRWPLVAVLAVTTTVGYGVLHYTFPVLLLPIARDLHADTTAVTAAFTFSILAGAFVAIPVGRWLDRYGGRALMTIGSLAATGLIATWSQARSLPTLYLVLTGIGITGAMTLYEPAIAVIVAWFPEPHRRANALLAVTVVAGFASTIFMPLAGHLNAHHGWRTTLLTLAAIYAAGTIPGHWLAVRRPPRRSTTTGQHRERIPLRDLIANRRLWILAVVFVAHATATSTIGVHLVTYLVERGHPATVAATITGLLGVLSVTGRLTLTTVARRLPTTSVVAVIFLVQGAAALALAAFAGSVPGAVASVITFGIGFGVAAIAQPALVTGLFGTATYATIAGVLAVPVTVARATAPLAAATTRTTLSSYLPVLIAVAGACTVAAAGVTALGPPRAGGARRIAGGSDKSAPRLMISARTERKLFG